MKELANMNRVSKPQKRTTENSTSSSSIKKKKKPSPTRSPLRDLNSTCVNPRISNGAPTRGCFNFFTSKSSRPQLRTPRSAPPNIRNQPKPVSGDSTIKRSAYERNRGRPISKDPILGRGYASKGKSRDPNISFDIDLQKNECLDSASDQELNLNSFPASGKTISGVGLCLNSTPEKSFTGFCHETDLHLQTKVVEKNLSNTPNSNATPPIQASISPEMAYGSNVDPTQACFAAGHVITGVQDRRKCRPRGILTVGENCDFLNQSQISPTVPPVAEASIRWLSSSSEKVDGFWNFSPPSSNTSRSPKLGELLGLSSPDFDATPSSGNGIRRTPTSGSSVSPFSSIVRKAAPKASGFKVYKPHEERNGYRYDTVRVSTPFNLDSMAEVFEGLTLSPKKDACDFSPPLPASSFQFNCPGTPSNSVDLTCFKKNSGEKTSREKDGYSSEIRISWRDGLVSRIFEMDELDCCQCLSDDNDNVDYFGEEKVESKLDSRNESLALKEETVKHIPSSSSSFEFPFVGIGSHGIEAKVLPQECNSCAESFSTDGGLICSGDSDWTLFYKNHLFEA